MNTFDYLATSNQIEFRAQKSNIKQQEKIKALFDQVQNLFTLYKTKPKFGPESCDDCLNFIAQLRPIENFFEAIEGKLGQNLGPPMNRDFMFDLDQVEMSKERNLTKADELDNNIEVNENELSKYSSKLNNYLNEKPIQRDLDLIYSTELGLVVERPMNNLDLGRIWSINL